MKPVLERQMEIYAGFMEHTDHHIGRLLDALEDLERLRRHTGLLIIGDNGATAEGNINGSFNEMFVFNGAAALETPEFVNAQVDSSARPTAYNHYAVGWAHAMDTPYQWTKQVARPGRHPQRHDRVLAERLPLGGEVRHSSTT